MIRLALIGKNIGHSKSPELYRELLGIDHEYDLIDCHSEKELPSLKSLAKVYAGANITSPYKKNYFSKVSVSEELHEIGAINCLKLSGDVCLGANTDLMAIRSLILKLSNDVKSRSMIILGNGVMARVVIKVLRENNLAYQQFSRASDGNISTLDLRKAKRSVVINTCSRDFVFNGSLSNDTIFWDLNYDFPDHGYLRNHVTYIDGYDLLKKQAEYAVKFWQL